MVAATEKRRWFVALMALPWFLSGPGTSPLAQAGQDERNLALGRPVVFAPRPNYDLTSAGGTDATDLTDGKLNTGRTDRLWFDRNCVAYSYAGQVQWSVDLGQVQAIEEVGIRLQGGSPQAGIALPPWVDVVVSTDGEHWHRAASYSRWREGDNEKYGIPRDEGRAWVHTLRFRDLRTCGRYVGLVLYTAALTVSDELWVLEGSHDPQAVRFDEGDRVAFTVEGVQMYFHKPQLLFSTNIHTPNPVGVIVAESVKGATATVEFDLPAGVRFAGGHLGGTELGIAARRVIQADEGEYTRYTLSCRAAQNEKNWGRLFLCGDWENGRKGHLRWRLRWADRDMPWMEQPIQAVRIEPAPQPKRLTTGLGWYNIEATLGWPESLTAYRTLGLNTIPLFARWVKPQDQARVGAFLDECRTQGFKIMNVDSPLHQMMTVHRRSPEIYCQFEDGRHGDKMCPSYRGTFYRQELERLADQTARVKADFLSCDIELFGGVQTYTQKCTRCRADFSQSGCADWSQWCLRKGEDMWMDLSTAVRSRPGMARIDLGGYDFRPGANYQNIWPIDRLYPNFMQNTQVSTYTPLYSYHLELIGNEVRTDRAKLPKSDIIPWLTPGDAGVFSGEMFRYALLECFANGARGLHFWSGRLWDTELLAAYARVMRNVAPVEDIIVEGELLAGATAAPAARVSGMRRGNQMLLLVADYWKPSGTKSVKVTIPVEVESRVIDLDTGRDAALVNPDQNSFTVDLDQELSRVLHVCPTPGTSRGAEPEELRLSPGYQAPLPTTDCASLDLAMDDERYLPVTLSASEDRAVRLDVEVPPDWSRQIAVWREERTAQRRQLVPLSTAPVWLKSNESSPAREKSSAAHVSNSPGVLWLQVSSRGKPAGSYRIPVRVRVDDAESSLTIELHVWPVSLAPVERPFHVRGYYMLTSLTGGYEVNELSIERLDAFFQTYADMGGDVFDWTVNWPQVLPRLRIAGTGRELGDEAKATPSPIDLNHLPGLDFSYFDPWFEVARRRGVVRFEAHVENVASERWQWALDAALGKGRVKTGTPEASRISAWVFGELKQHVERQGFHGFFAKISDEILPEDIPSYLVTAQVARQAGWRPFTTITATIPRTAEHVRAMDPLCDQWQLSFKSVDEFFHLRQQRYAISEVTIPLDAKWSRYTNGGAEHTWSARNVFGAESLTGIPAHEVETLVVLEDGKPLTMSGNGGWGNRKRGIALMHAFDEVMYLSPSDDREPKEHRIDLKIVRRREDPAGKILVSLDPGDEIWCYGGPGRPDQLPYGNTWSLPAMALYRGLDGYAQWAFQWWKDDHRIVWMEPQTRRIVLSPAYCGFRDGWRDAVLFSQVLRKAGRATYEKMIGPHATATLRVAATKDPTYPVDHRSIPLVTSIANAGDLGAVNAARREALKVLAESTPTESLVGNLAPSVRSIQNSVVAAGPRPCPRARSVPAGT